MTTDRIEAIYRKIGLKIQSLRQDENLTQEQLAQKTQLSRPSIVHIEQGKQRLPIDRLYRIAAALQKPIELFLPPVDSFQDLDSLFDPHTPDPSTQSKPSITADTQHAVLEKLKEVLGSEEPEIETNETP